MAHLTSTPYIGQYNINKLLYDLSSALYIQYGTNLQPFNMLIVGGAALALKYDFRMTVDIDADIKFAEKLSDAIVKTARYNNIPTDWLNWEFMKSYSYSRRLWENAIFYKQIGYITVYVVSDLDQLCMKAVAGRDKDLGDAIFIAGKLCMAGISYTDFVNRVQYLYGNSVKVSSKVNKKIANEFKKYKMK